MHSSFNTGKVIKAERKLLLTAFYDLYEYDSLWRKVSHPFLCFKVAEHLKWNESSGLDRTTGSKFNSPLINATLSGML